mgnify:CR=1 FL=1
MKWKIITHDDDDDYFGTKKKRNSSKIRCVYGKYIPGIQVNQQPNADKMYACTESQGSWMHMERMTENKNRTNNKKKYIVQTNQKRK